MKPMIFNRATLSFLLTTILLTAGSGISNAQFRHTSIDTDLRDLRNTAIPSFNYKYDDYLQYSPAALMLALKAAGYESRTNWSGMLTSAAFSTAIQAAVVNGIKYSVGRQRPDGTSYNSFPSGHTATAFMTATLLHKEYGWRSPWFSIGGYTAAAITGVSRLMNNRHWMSDIVAGAAIGIGSVHLGYFITDKIFKGNHLTKGYYDPEFFYDGNEKHYAAELLFGRRFFLPDVQNQLSAVPERGSMVGIQTDIPIISGRYGATARVAANSCSFARGGITSDMYTIAAGGYWNLPFARILEFQTRMTAGYAYMQGDDALDVSAGIGLSLIIDSNFKLKVFTDYETYNFKHRESWMNTILVGYSASWFW